MHWSHTLRTSLSVGLAAAAGAQVPTDTTLVLTQRTGPALAQVLAVSSTGAVTPFGRFPSDGLAPLAIEVDPIDRHVLVALDLGGGSSRLLRLLPAAGLAFAGEVLLADLPARCEQLAVDGDHLLAIGSGPQGGVFRLPRRGGAPTLAYGAANATAWQGFGGGQGILGWSGISGPPPQLPGLGYVDLGSSAITYGPFPFTNLPGAQVAGLIDLPTGLSRQLVGLRDGSFVLHVGGLGAPTPVPMTPQPPPGGVAAFKSEGYAFAGLAVGGAAFPNLYRADWNGSVTVLANLPGDPQDLVPPLSPFPQVTAFGAGCGAPALQLVTGVMGPPQLGNLSFDLRVANALPGQILVFAVGVDDVAGGQLPWSLPGGCALEVAPLATAWSLANPGGGGRQALPIPALPSLAGTLVFAQWLQPSGAGFATSAAAAVAIGP